ncbi:hypothetical protein F5884DRAFT_503615 [Xylogone sp. PMI_703]|nr:hypothetical protein F5884DRAFT_503615 [Xylogone sp. PMI_703]
MLESAFQISPSSSTAPSSSSTESWGSAIKGVKQGRPNKWTSSRQRKLARLYLYTSLPREDIPRVLKDKEDNWTPGKESTTKTVNAILDKEPRWLRPKGREDMEKKISRLSECKTQRKYRRQWPISSPIEAQRSDAQSLDAILSTEFSETPLEDLLASVPKESLMSFPDCSTGAESLAHPNPSLYSDENYPFPEEPILPQYMLGSSSNIDVECSQPMDAMYELPAIDEKRISSTYLSMISLKRRLSQYSTLYVKAIARVMKAYSISDSSAATTVGPAYSISINTDGASTIDDQTIKPLSLIEASLMSRIPRLVLPDSILVLDRYVKRQGACFPGLKRHDSKMCWCLEELYTDSRVWVCEAGLVNYSRDDPPRRLRGLDIGFRDLFGNSILHMLAARGADLTVMIEALLRGADGNAKNTANQNFLHVLHPRHLALLATDQYYLQTFLQQLNTFNVNFFDYDIFGRSFCHLLTRRAWKLGVDITPVLSYLNIQPPFSRDAFGWLPTCDTSVIKQFEFDMNQRVRGADLESSPLDQYTSASNETSEIDITSLSKILPIGNLSNLEEVTSFLSRHARLLEISRGAMNSPHIEDSEGRNGLQCLAEAALNIDTITTMNALANKSTKRKRDQNLPDFSKQFTFRYETAQNMVYLGVSVNHYDKNGNTVLMAFVTYLPDGDDDKKLAELLHYLIKAGADVRRRNRLGETALHIAVRLGRKVATRVLLQAGANVHARTSEGKGVLAVSEMYYFRARDDPKLYASIMACMALCIEYDAVAMPTLIQE